MRVNVVRVTAECPHCERRFHQIDFSQEHAIDVVEGAVEKHLAAEHPTLATHPGSTR